ncbi:MAG: hypothetical protein LQ337_008176, partial [Flavoplaca oasis]
MESYVSQNWHGTFIYWGILTVAAFVNILGIKFFPHIETLAFIHHVSFFFVFLVPLITLCGDSAGGNLILGLLSHLLHPHPSLPPLTLPSPLLGAALVSPWGDFSTRAPSFTRNAANDSINGAVLQKWAAYFMDGARADNYNQPFLAADHWWRNLQGVVQELLVTVGTDEVLVDGIKGFTKTIEAVHPRTRAIFAPREFHDQPFMETDGDVRRCQQGRVLKA